MKKIKRHPLEASPLYNVRRRKDLARILNTNEKELQALTKSPLYSVKDIITDKGKKRHTETPVKQLRAIHERVERILMRIEPPSFLYCPVKGRSQISNAARHRGSRVFHTLDIKEYFPSTPQRRVFWFFNQIMGCARDVSAILATLTTREGHLPTGSPLSPILAFYAFYDMWTEVAAIGERNGLILTVYMDDVTVSGNAVPGDILWQIKNTIFRTGLRYHKERVYRDRPAIVTGIIVDGQNLLLPHRQHLKAHAARKRMCMTENLLEMEALESSLKGLMGHRRQVRLISSNT